MQGCVPQDSLLRGVYYGGFTTEDLLQRVYFQVPPILPHDVLWRLCPDFCPNHELSYITQMRWHDYPAAKAPGTRSAGGFGVPQPSHHRDSKAAGAEALGTVTRLIMPSLAVASRVTPAPATCPEQSFHSPATNPNTILGNIRSVREMPPNTDDIAIEVEKRPPPIREAATLFLPDLGA